jgi:hypothetical protein
MAMTSKILMSMIKFKGLEKDNLEVRLSNVIPRYDNKETPVPMSTKSAAQPRPQNFFLISASTRAAESESVRFTRGLTMVNQNRR